MAKKNVFNSKVSVIIPVYNTAKYLPDCLDSITHQTYRNLEIICVDDGSTDGSINILKYYMRKDRRITAFYEKHGGQSHARNIGLKHATGKYVCFVDSDDFLIGNAIFQCMEVLSKKKVDMVIFNLEAFFADGSHFPCYNGRLYQAKYPILHSKQDKISVNFTNAVSAFVDRDIIVKNELSFDEGMIYEDWVFMVRLMLCENIKYFWLNSPLYWYRRDVNKSTTTRVDSACMDLFNAYEKANDIIDNSNVSDQFKFINDTKIVSESVGLLLSRVIFSDDIELVEGYISRFIKVILAFPDSYMKCIGSFLSDEGRSFIMEVCNGMISTTKSKKNIIMDLRKRYEKTNCIVKPKRFSDRLERRMVKIFLLLSPTYRATSVVRREVRDLRQEVDCIRNSINQLSV